MVKSAFFGGSRSFRAGFAGVCAVALGALVVPPAAASGDIWSVNSGRIYVEGGGYGHGKGMSQYGAQGAALRGVGYEQILRFYYPGTTMGSAANVLGRDIRVKLDNHKAGRWLRVGAFDGGSVTVTDTATGEQFELTDAPYFRVWLGSDGSWTLQKTDAATFSDTVHTLTGEAKFTSSGGPLTVAFPDGAKAKYRGEVYAGRDGTNVVAFNHLPLEEYLQSVVPAEVILSWQPAALQAQAVAARTYALHLAQRKSSSARFDVCSTVWCQVYLGVDKESPRTTSAVQATAGQVLLADGRPALTMFGSSNGGFAVGYSSYTASRSDLWDAGSHNPVHNWTKDVSLARLKSKWPQIGDPLYVHVRKRDGNGRWGGRIVSADVFGTSGKVTVTGPQLRFAAGLRSELAHAPLTGILHEWQKMGGANGYLGQMTSGEYGIHGGRIQDFSNGRVMWSEEGGPHPLYGAIGATYFANNGPVVFGPPVTHEFAVPGGQQQNFKYGQSVWSPQYGAFMIFGGISHHFQSHGGVSRFGLPTSGEFDVVGGRAQKFTGGQLVWNRSRNEVSWKPL